jgi:hypothetical protein
MTTLYWVLGVAAALVASGLASRAWGDFRKRLFRDFGGVLLKLYTFGSKQLETNLFKTIAMRPKKDASLLLLYLVFSGVAAGFCVQALGMVIPRQYVPWAWMGGFLFLLVVGSHPCLKIVYCEFYTLRFDLYMAMARPYLSEAEVHQYNARFAGLESKQQHMELCDEVKLRAIMGKRAAAGVHGRTKAVEP